MEHHLDPDNTQEFFQRFAEKQFPRAYKAIKNITRLKDSKYSSFLLAVPKALRDTKRSPPHHGSYVFGVTDSGRREYLGFFRFSAKNTGEDIWYNHGRFSNSQGRLGQLVIEPAGTAQSLMINDDQLDCW